MRWADARGDSFGLSRIAADRSDAEYIVFCGVHFMAESADVLTGERQQVLLPDLNAGCSMADMADIDAVEEAWEDLARVTDVDRVVPITYMNSSAALKAFVGRHGGSVCTSSNARAVLTWALDPSRGDKVLFFPDQHLGRNTGFQLGYGRRGHGRVEPAGRVRRAVRDRGQDGPAAVVEGPLLGPPALPARARRRLPGRASRTGSVVVHPECAHDVVEVADQVGSTDYIIRAVADAPAGSVIGVGTEIHLVKRLDDESPGQDGGLPRPPGLPLLDHVPHRPHAPGLGAGGAGGGRGPQPDHRRRRHGRWARVALERMLATV